MMGIYNSCRTPVDKNSEANRKTINSAFCLTADLASLFECPVCFEYVSPPILQCQSGHLVCSKCRLKLNVCPICRNPLGNIRNLAMEQVALSVKFPYRYACKYSGCSISLLDSEKIEHEELCEHRPYTCPYPSAHCEWRGRLDQVHEHFMKAHKSVITLQGEDIFFLVTNLNHPSDMDWVMVQSCFGHHFMFVLKKHEKSESHQQFFGIVQLIGSRFREHFTYKLELKGYRRHLVWKAAPISIHEKVTNAMLRSDCLVFDTCAAQLFAKDDNNLIIRVTISTND